MSKLQVFTVESFHKLNPSWNINIYTPIQKYEGRAKYIPNYTGKDYFYLIKNMNYINIAEVDLAEYGVKMSMHNILRSDIFRYYILYNCGGVWSDFDVIWLRPMEHINNIESVGNVSIRDMGAMVTFYKTTEGHHNIGVLLSAKGHPFYKVLIEKTIDIQNSHLGKDDKFEHQSFGSTLWNSLYPNLNSVIDEFSDVVGFKYQTFAPYSIYDIERLYLKKDLTPLNDNNVVGLHWFNGHQLSKDYINQNKFGDKSSMTLILQNIGFKNV